MLPVADQKLFEWMQRIQWDNTYSKEIAALVGDPDVRVGYDAAAGKWFIAQMMPHLLRTYGNTGETREVRVLPHIIQAWELDGVPLVMQSADIARHLLGSRVDVMEKVMPEMKAREEAKQRSEQRDAEDRRRQVAKDLRPLLAKLGDESGVSYHRPTGPDARRISSASLWRAGAGA